MIKVVFVCLGNICRSPMAEAAFQEMVDEVGLSDQIEVDSCGTSRYHIGEPAHPGTRQILAEHGIQYRGSARQVTTQELREAEYIIAMDSDNLYDLKRVAPSKEAESRMHRLLDFSSQAAVRDVPDPYFTNNFTEVYQLVEDACQRLLQHIRTEENI